MWPSYLISKSPFLYLQNGKWKGLLRRFVVVQSLSCVLLFVTPWTAAHQATLSSSISQGLPNSCPLSQWCYCTISFSAALFLCLQSFPASGFSPEKALHIRWPKYGSFNFSISPSSEYSGLISFRVNLFDLLGVQGTLKSLLQHHNSKASILWHSAFFMMTAGKTIALTIQTFVGGAIGKELARHCRRHKRWSLGQENPLEEEMATQTSILAWRSSWTEEPGGLQFIGSKSVGHDWNDLTCTCCVWLVTESCPILCDPMDCSPPGSSVHGVSPGKNTGVGCHALLQGIFPIRDRTQVSHIACGFFAIWASSEAQEYWSG